MIMKNPLPWVCGHYGRLWKRWVVEMGLFWWLRQKIKPRVWVQYMTFSFACLPSRSKGFQGRYSLWFSLFLSKNSQAELPILVGLEGGGHDEVLSPGQRHAAGDLAQVHVGVGPSCWPVPCKESTACLHICAAFQLWRMCFLLKTLWQFPGKTATRFQFQSFKAVSSFSLCKIINPWGMAQKKTTRVLSWETGRWLEGARIFLHKDYLFTCLSTLGTIK